MAEFNLIDKPWIPCIDLQGTPVEYGVRDTLLKAHELREVNDNSPLVTAAVHRLLLAILYRAQQGPKGFTSWRRMYSFGKFDEQVVCSYLSTWGERFDLIDERRPFYQVGNFETKSPVSITRLATECASGHNVTLFDHSRDDAEVSWSLAKAARYLVSCQAFALGFGKSSNARIGGVEEPTPYSADAIALRGMNIWLQGANMFETLGVNLVPIDDQSLPPWELDDPSACRDRRESGKAVRVGSSGVVDRLTWQSRLIRLLPAGHEVSMMYYAQGRSADKSVGDPMKAYRSSRTEGVSALPLSGVKAAWRDAHAILAIPPADSHDESRPECFNLVARAHAGQAVDAAKPFIVHIVGLASAPNKAGKFLLWRHEHMPVLAAIVSNVHLIERLGGLLLNAEQAAVELNSRMRRLARLYLAPNCEVPGGGQPDANNLNDLIDAIDARPAYWARLEEHFFTLLETLLSDWDEEQGEWRPDEQQTASCLWREHVKREAQRALEESVRSLGSTVRAIRAVARVRTDFYDSDLKPHASRGRKPTRKGGTEE